MKTQSLLPTIFLSSILTLTFAGVAQAQLIGSESFATPTGYVAGIPFGKSEAPAQNRGNTIGTVGFASTDLWQRNTANVTPVEGGLTHPLLAGTAAAGNARIQPPSGALGGRAAYRKLAVDPVGTTFYMSGLVSLGGNLDNLKDNQMAAMGVAPYGAEASFLNFFPMGFGLGVIRDSDSNVYLAAFAGSQFYTMGSALTTPDTEGVQMIVLKLEIGAGATDTLTGWYAGSGSTQLIQAFSLSGLNIADSGSQLNGFGVVGMPTDSGTTGLGNVAMDEWRFGTTLESVVTVPEPAAVALFGLSAMAICFFRRTRTA